MVVIGGGLTRGYELVLPPLVTTKEQDLEAEDDRGITTFWSTPEGLYESWRPHQHQGRGKPRR